VNTSVLERRSLVGLKLEAWQDSRPAIFGFAAAADGRTIAQRSVVRWIELGELLLLL